MWRAGAVTLAIVLASTLVCAQQAPQTTNSALSAPPQKSESAAKPKPPAPSAEEKWLYPAQRVSADFEQQAANLKRDLHAVAFTTLGSYWWKVDQPAAERWIYPAVDEITLVPQEETDSNRNVRLEAARRVLAIVSPLAPLLRDRIKDVVTSAASRQKSDGRMDIKRWQAADAIVIAGESGDSAQVGRAIEESLDYGVTSTTIDAISNLSRRSPDEAKRLFEVALAQASRGGDDLHAFSAIFQMEGIPAEWKQSVVEVLANVFSNSSIDENSRCAWASQFVPTAQSGDAGLERVVAMAMSHCAGTGSDAQTIQRENPQTSDEYLKVASEAKSPSARFQMKLTAGEKAEEEAKKDDNPGPDDGPVKALRILDGMTSEERAVGASEYKHRREDVAVRAALWTRHFSGCSAGLRVIDTSPRETILHVAVGVADKITEPSCYGELMRTTVLRQIDRIPPEDPNDYIHAVNLVLKRGPYPEQSLQQILRSMDLWKERDPKAVARGDAAYAAPWNKLYPLGIVSELFDLSPDTLRAIARGYFRNELLRADFELTLVKGFLDRYGRDLQKEKAEKAETATN